jgi:hypothetical protein
VAPGIRFIVGMVEKNVSSFRVIFLVQGGVISRRYYKISAKFSEISVNQKCLLNHQTDPPKLVQ